MTMNKASHFVNADVAHHSRAGFTLIEMVIVLGITGLIFSGLWGLLTSGSSQLQAQAAAQQYRQVIDATRKYITSEVAPYVSTQPAGLVATPPTVADLKTANLLSSSFSTLDAYGNTILIAVDTIDASKQQWRFSVYASAGGLTDKVGAQVSSLIGSEGGFVYNNATDGCSGTVNATACGAFNSFTLSVADFGIAAASGRIVTLAYTNDTNAGTAPWLYRKAAITPEQNTMSQDMLFNNGLSLSMQGSKIIMGGGNLSMGTDAATTGGGTFYMGAGTIANIGNMNGSNSTWTFNNTTMTVNNLSVNSATSVDIAAGTGSVNVSTTSGTVALSINGTGRADEFQAQKFIYSSDRRMKENLMPITNALQKVLLLRGFSYDWKGGHGHDVGLMAQDVEKVFPELVTKSEGSMGVDYAKIIAPVVEAIRELKAENDELRHKVDALQKKLGTEH